MILPWQKKQWQFLWQLKQANKLPHAMLFTGLAGMGKKIFAEFFSRALLCQQQEFQFDCECHSCRLALNRSHPNLQWIEPEKPGQAIKIDQIRELPQFIYQSALQGKYRVVIICPAENMNANAANALLKTLEEPSAESIIILISHKADKLPATISSRCQRFSFPPPAKQDALNWLQTQVSKETDVELLLNLTYGAPLAAVKLLESDILSLRADLFSAISATLEPVKTAHTLLDMEAELFLDLMVSWLIDLVRLQIGINTVVNYDYEKHLLKLKSVTQINSNIKLLNYTQKIRQEISNGINLNKQLMMENILIRWTEVNNVSS